MKHRNTPAVLILTALLLATLTTLHAASVASIRCEYLENPLGIDTQKPRLSWIIESTHRGERQTAYRILVASTPGLLAKDQGDLWDSGKVLSDRQIQVEYSGKLLDSREQCYWKVCVWDAADKSYWSQPAQWTMGVLKPEDWPGRWIGASNEPVHQPIYLRRDCVVAKQVRRAIVSFYGLGWSELSIGGKQVGDYVMGPGATCYDKRVQYLTFDVTDHFQELGSTTVDVVLFDG